MAKPGMSKKSRAPSVHSRAARRAASPSINTDKSLEGIRPPRESLNQRPAVLAAHHSSGVTKKTRKVGRKAVLSSKARKRQEKSMSRAEAVMDRTANKVAASKGQARVLRSRRKPWEEVNSALVEEVGGKRKGTKGAEEEEGEEEEEEEEDIDGDEKMDVQDDGDGKEGGQPAAAPQAAEDEDYWSTPEPNFCGTRSPNYEELVKFL